MKNEPDINKIVPFAKERGINSPTTLIFPIHYHAKDGLVHCYPGDEFYPNNPNYSTTEHDLDKYADKTCDECREIATHLHRLEIKSMPSSQIWQNVKLPDNHLSAQTTFESKL